jgi:hypothetical protein
MPKGLAIVSKTVDPQTGFSTVKSRNNDGMHDKKVADLNKSD